jgi:hypothetical protein
MECIINERFIIENFQSNIIGVWNVPLTMWHNKHDGKYLKAAMQQVKKLIKLKSIGHFSNDS